MLDSHSWAGHLVQFLCVLVVLGSTSGPQLISGASNAKLEILNLVHVSHYGSRPALRIRPHTKISELLTCANSSSFQRDWLPRPSASIDKTALGSHLQSSPSSGLHSNTTVKTLWDDVVSDGCPWPGKREVSTAKFAKEPRTH